MSRNLLGLILLGLFVSLGFSSCAEDTKIEDPRANWKERNEIYLDSIVNVARNAPAGETWRIYKNYKLEVSDKFPEFFEYDSVYVKYISPVLSEEYKEKERPTAKDTVSLYYQGYLMNGERFDGNYTGKLNLDVHTPVKFVVDEVIVGLSTVLQNMVEKEQVEAYIPYQMAYGREGHDITIPGYSVLKFEIYLEKIIHPKGPDDRSRASKK